MAEVKVKKLRQALERKGFRLSERNHHYYYFYHEGKKTRVKTKISHGNDSISDPLIHSMRNQMKLNKNQFFNFVECPLTEAEYIEILRGQGIDI